MILAPWQNQRASDQDSTRISARVASGSGNTRIHIERAVDFMDRLRLRNALRPGERVLMIVVLLVNLICGLAWMAQASYDVGPTDESPVAFRDLGRP